LGTTPPSDPCYTGSYGSFEDYTLNIVPCTPANQCVYTANLVDDWGDGWNNGIVSFELNGVELGTIGANFTNGSSALDSVSLCDGDTITVILKNAGSYPAEIGFDVLNSQGVTMFSHPFTTGLSSGDVLGTFYSQCVIPSCPISDVPSVMAQTSCGPNPVTFTAMGSTVPNQGYFWVRSSDTAIVALGETFTTPPITGPETWYLGIGSIDEQAAPIYGGMNLAGSTGGYGNFTNGQWFTALDVFYLDSITVRANGPLSFMVRISEPAQAGAGAEIILSDTITVTGAGDFQVPVGLAVSPGHYFMNISFVANSGGGALWRTTAGASYPYTIGSVATIDSVNIASPRMYYTFDWVVREVCTSTLAAANASFAPVPSTTFPYAEDFNDGLPCNWSLDNSGAEWMNVSDYSGSSLDSNFMFIDDDVVGSSVLTESSMYSPVFNTQGYDTLWIEFDHYYRATSNSTGNVEVWDGSQWISVYSVGSSTVGSWATPDHQAIDITMYQNADLQVRFRYDDGSDWAWYWAVDNFEMDGTPLPCQNVVVDIVTDIYGSETTWSIVDTATGTVYASGGPYADVSPYNAALATHVDTICLPLGIWYEFRLNDSFGDGLFDGTNTGTYSVDILCPWGNNNVIMGSGAYPYGSTTNPPSYDSTVFEVTCLVGCPDPTNLAVVPGCTDADISWDSDSAAVSTLQWGPEGFTPGTGNFVYGATSTYNLTGLALGTSYDVWVLDTCWSGSVSNWVGPVTFTTDSLPEVMAAANLVSSGDTVTYSFTATGTGTSYDWTFGDGGTGTGASTSHDYTANGTYTVIVTATNDCGTSTDTIQVLVEGIGIDEFGFGNISLYPNPNDGYFTLSGLTAFGSDAKIEVVTMTGTVVYSKNVVANGSETFTIDLRGYAPGVYQVRVSSKEGVGTKPFIIRN